MHVGKKLLDASFSVIVHFVKINVQFPYLLAGMTIFLYYNLHT